MNHIPDYTEEKQALLKKNGFYVPPYRFASMSKIAAKVVNMVMVNTEYTPSYADARLVLEMALLQLDKVTGKEVK